MIHTRSVAATAISVVLAAGLIVPAGADEVDTAAVTVFESSTPALASDVNATIAALVTAINDNAARIAALEDPGSVAGGSFQLFGLEIGNETGNNAGVAGSTFMQDEIDFDQWSLTLDEGGTGTLNQTWQSSIAETTQFSGDINGNNVVTGVVHNLFPDSGTSNGLAVTYTVNGSVLSVTVPDDGETDIVQFQVSRDGNTLISNQWDSGVGFANASILVGVRVQ